LEYVYDVYLLRPNGTFKIEYRERVGNWDSNTYGEPKVWVEEVEEEPVEV
jgi:hypothetical protein